MPDDLPNDTPDQLVPDPEVCREFGITLMTLWRWDQDPNLGFPPKVKIRERNHRSRKQVEAFKRQLMQQALKHRHRHPAVTRDTAD
jgi:predicted DNA-binding transcriptional regulator AlpA